MHCARCAIIVITIVTVAYMHQETALILATMPCQDSPYSVVVWQVPEAAMLRASPKSIL